MRYLTYRCAGCKKSYQRTERIDHTCPICNRPLDRNRLEDKRILVAKQQIQEYDNERTNQS